MSDAPAPRQPQRMVLQVGHVGIVFDRDDLLSDNPQPAVDYVYDYAGRVDLDALLDPQLSPQRLCAALADATSRAQLALTAQADHLLATQLRDTLSAVDRTVRGLLRDNQDAWEVWE